MIRNRLSHTPVSREPESRTRRPARPAFATRRGLSASCVALVLLVLLTGGKPAPVLVDRIWTRPDFDRVGVRVVAILPAATFTGNHEAADYVTDDWPRAFRDRGYEWVTANLVRAGLGETNRSRDSLLRVLTREIQSTGRPAPASAARIARRYGAQALLAIRVDRWERQSGAMDMAYVDLTATLVDSAGGKLWEASGRARAEVLRDTPPRDLPEPSRGITVVTVPLPGAVSGATSGSGSSGGGSGTGPGQGSGEGSGSGSGGSGRPSSSSNTPPPAYYKVQQTRRDAPSLNEVVPDSGPAEAAVAPEFETAVRSLFGAWAPRLPQSAGARAPKR